MVRGLWKSTGNRCSERIADRYTCLRAPNRGRFMDAEFQQYQMRKFHSLPPGGKYPCFATEPNINIERVKFTYKISLEILLYGGLGWKVWRGWQIKTFINLFTPLLDSSPFLREYFCLHILYCSYSAADDKCSHVLTCSETENISLSCW